MTDEDRLVAWATEMTRVHERLREAVEVVRAGLAEGSAGLGSRRDLLLHCWGFCQALTGHHDGEDAVLFPVLREQHPELGEVVDRLEHDHRMLEHLIGGLGAAIDRREDPARVAQHLDGVATVMESHFGYEERQLLGVLGSLRLDADVQAAFGPLT